MGVLVGEEVNNFSEEGSQEISVGLQGGVDGSVETRGVPMVVADGQKTGNWSPRKGVAWGVELRQHSNASQTGIFNDLLDILSGVDMVQVKGTL